LRNVLAPPETRLFLNGKILTMDSENRIAEAVVVRDGRIIAVGTSEGAKKWIDDDSVVLDLNGKTMMPGIIDAHGHFPGTGLYAFAVDLNSPPIGKISNISQIIEALSEKAAHTDKGDWILGLGYDDTLLSEQRHPTREDLDQASTEHAIVILHISGHLGVANSLALRIAGITSETESPEGAVIRKDPVTGEPTGILEECAIEIFTPLLDFSILDMLKTIRRASNDCLRAGMTTTQDGLADGKRVENLALATRIGIIPLRVVVWPDEALGMKIVRGEFDPEKYNSDKFQVGAVKLLGDGSTQGFTAYLREPYHTQFKGDADYRGYPRIEREKLVEKVKTFHRAGLQIAVHSNGDAAIDNFIYAFRQAQQEYHRQDARPIVVHGQMMRAEHLDAIKELGMTPTYHLVHPFYWGDRHWNIFLGPERASGIYPAKSTLDRGIPFSIHLDAPVVPLQPMLLVWSAVNRLSRSERVIGPDERIAPIQALRAITIDAAWQIFQENDLGSIEVGKYADLIVLSGDPLGDPHEIRNIQVEKTIIGGKTAYEREH
ncbi:MAG: amidohydrolase, partial [Candidatus Hydrogenedentota bacterium]